MTTQLHSTAAPSCSDRAMAHLSARHSCLWALCLLAVHAFSGHSAQAAVTEVWVNRYNVVVTNSNDQAYKVVRDAAGDIIVTGTTDNGITRQDMLTAKYSGADGSAVWQARYNGPGNTSDEVRALGVDGTGNVVVAGHSYDGSNYNTADYYTAKYAAADGALLWEKRYNGPARSGDQATAVAVDASGNVVVTGFSYSSNFAPDFYTAKYGAADGALLWEKRYNGPANDSDQATAVVLDLDGNVVVTGVSEGDYYTAKYAAANGALLWEKRYNPSIDYDQATAVAVDADGNVVVTGYSGGPNFNSDFYTAKYSASDGALLWEKRYNGPANSDDRATAVTMDGGGNVVVAGYSAGGFDSFGNQLTDFYTAKYAAANGTLLWEKHYNGPANTSDGAAAVAVDSSGNVVVTGHSAGGFDSFGKQLTDYYTSKYAAADGTPIWEKRYNGPANSDDRAQAVVVDGTGNVVVAGFSTSGFDYFFGKQTTDYYTAKYAAANGALLWEKSYNGPANSEDQARAVAMDGAGNVVVTGFSVGSNLNSDYYTAKYALADGALLWEKRYNGVANSEDRATAMALDGSGNVVVTGFSYNGMRDVFYTAKYAAVDGVLLWEKTSLGTRPSAISVDAGGNVLVTGFVYAGRARDYYTAKYAAANGALLWEKYYNFPDGDSRSEDYATAVAADESGNVVVTGFSVGDAYTAKYSAVDGTLIWEKRYNGPANQFDSAAAVALDKSGNVVVTGYSYNASYNSDFYTAKYSAADGALLWEKRYNGLANSEDQAAAVALDKSGNVVVTGYSSTANFNPNFYTAKYAAANGALLWEKRYNGPGSSEDFATSVAVDSSGNVLVTGYLYNMTNDVFYTAKYASANGTLLWEKSYSGGNSHVGATVMAVSPGGIVAIAGAGFPDEAFSPRTTSDYATIVYREILSPVTIAADGIGGYFIRASAIAGSIYELQRSTSVSGPWMSNATVTAASPNLIEFTTPMRRLANLSIERCSHSHRPND